MLAKYSLGRLTSSLQDFSLRIWYLQMHMGIYRIYNDDELIMKFLTSSEINFVVLIAKARY